MGYYTTYDLEVEATEVKVPIHAYDADGNPVTVYKHSYYEASDFIKEIEDLTGYSDNIFGDSVKWYDHEKDMRTISRKYPEVTFILSGEGEESGDIWKKYFKNGRMFVAKARIVFPEYDESKLD